MKCISMLILVLLLNRAVQYARCHTIYIIPTPDSPCPGAIIGQPCFTLEQYAANPSRNAKITLQLYPGNHSMNRIPLAILNINSFTMKPINPGSVTVMCGQQLPPGNSFWFTFTGVPTVHISDITFNGCKFRLNSDEIAPDIVVNVEFMKSSFVNNTCCNDGSVLDFSVDTALTIVKECIFSDNRLQRAVIATSGNNNLTVDQSVFKNNSVFVSIVPQLIQKLEEQQYTTQVIIYLVLLSIVTSVTMKLLVAMFKVELSMPMDVPQQL